MRRFSPKAVSSLATALVSIVFVVEAAAATGNCGQPVTGGASPSVTDCQFILKASVGIETCASECVCDTNGNGVVTTGDALRCLQSVVGGPAMQLCRCLVGPGGPEINESCAVCHGPGRVFGVEEVHAGLQTRVEVVASIDDVSIDVNDAMRTATLTVDFTVTGPRGEYIWASGRPRRPGRTGSSTCDSR